MIRYSTPLSATTTLRRSSVPSSALLGKLHFNPAQDTLIPAGDFLTKSTDEGSLAVLSFLAAHNASAVRGNHDQPVVEWRAWQEWIDSLPPRFDDIASDDADDGVESTRRLSGKEWLASLDLRFALTTLPREQWLSHERKRGPRSWWARIPPAWRDDMFDDAYRIARCASRPAAALLAPPPAADAPAPAAR